MNGVHDMGGMDGFGEVEPAEPDEPIFHEAWEGRVMAMTRALGASGVFNIDMSRVSREELPPGVYLTSSYYEKWFLGLVQMLRERGLLGDDELKAGHALRSAPPLERRFTTADLDRIMTRASFGRPPPAPARFTPGDRVLAKNIHPRTHTRLPRYVRGHAGVVERAHGCHVFPDSSAVGAGEDPQWLYTVRFAATDLWGDEADPTVKVSVEAFEPYLEPA